MATEETVTIDNPNNPGELISVPASQAPVAMQPLVRQAPPKRRTSLVAGNNPWDFTLVLDGLAVYCKQWTPALRDWVTDGFYQDVSTAIGCTVEVAKDNEALGMWVADDATGERERTLEALALAQYDRIISEGMVDWASPEPCAEFRLQMPLALKKTFANDYARACKFGQRKSDFLL